MNSVKLYSNGTAVIGREYSFPDDQPLKIAIPVRKTDLDDVISSIGVFGDVAVVSPPSYTPTNAEETALELDPSKIFQEMATKLAGAAVEVDAGRTYAGRLVGMNRFISKEGDTKTERYRLVVLTEKGVQTVDEASITAIRFTEPAVRDEVDKALKVNLGKIKPDSSLVELAVKPNTAGAQALVVYATPVAAWKIRYHLRLDGGKMELEGQAIVDNDTDDDWTDTMITVITGEPITFSTDLAEIRRPERSRVNLVSDRARGAVFASAALSAPPHELLSEMTDYAAITKGGGVRQSDDVLVKSSMKFRGLGSASQPRAKVRESGDFSIYTSPNPISIGAKRSGIIPLFLTSLEEPQKLLLYKPGDDEERPYRALRFRNGAAHSLGRGLCEVSIDGDFQGKCVLEATKPGEDATLVYARETGVRVHMNAAYPERTLSSIRISKGAGISENILRKHTVYSVKNSHAEPFVLDIEHGRDWQPSQFRFAANSGEIEVSDIDNGKRASVNLPAGGTLALEVWEETVQESTASIDTAWLGETIIKRLGRTVAGKEIERCFKLKAEIAVTEEHIKKADETIATLEEEQKRLIQLIPSGHGEQANQWRTDLASAETELRKLKREEKPKFKEELNTRRAALAEALKGLRFEWKGNG